MHAVLWLFIQCIGWFIIIFLLFFVVYSVIVLLQYLMLVNIAEGTVLHKIT